VAPRRVLGPAMPSPEMLAAAQAYAEELAARGGPGSPSGGWVHEWVEQNRTLHRGWPYIKLREEPAV
jgi:hypothetical protein